LTTLQSIAETATTIVDPTLIATVEAAFAMKGTETVTAILDARLIMILSLPAALATTTVASIRTATMDLVSATMDTETVTAILDVRQISLMIATVVHVESFVVETRIAMVKDSALALLMFTTAMMITRTDVKLPPS